MKNQSRLLLLRLLLLSTWCCDKTQSFALSQHHSTISSRNRRHQHRQVRGIASPQSTTMLEYRTDSDLPDVSSSQSSILPTTKMKNKATKAKSSRRSRNENEEAQHQGQKSCHRGRSPPVRRSFLHQLDRFLTALQGTVCHAIIHLIENDLTFAHRRCCYFHTVSRSNHAGTDDHLRKHTFLKGNFAPVSKEHVSILVEVVEGSIPSNLNGAFCRNGPNPILDVLKKRYHWFDGREFVCPVECLVVFLA